MAKLGLDFSASSWELWSPVVQWVLWSLYLSVSVSVGYYVFRLSRVVYGLGPGVICAALILLPCAGSLTVLILNGNTMDRLRKAGVKVGMMGATAKEVEQFETALQSAEPVESVSGSEIGTDWPFD